MINVLQIPRLTALLSKCWKDAECVLQAEISQHAPGASEELITQNFHKELSRILTAASANRSIELAFLNDLDRSDWRQKYKFDSRRIARGLVAEVTLHKPETEKLSGGDLGFVVVRPQLQLARQSINISEMRQGLLVQAKLKGLLRWGTFTRNQERVLPKRMDYLALLLYQYADPERRMLASFVWQLADGMSFEDLKACLKRDHFRNTLDSSRVIACLTSGRIGTAERQLIDTLISPDQNRALIIRIHWPDGEPPSSALRVHSAYETRQTVKNVISR